MTISTEIKQITGVTIYGFALINTIVSIKDEGIPIVSGFIGVSFAKNIGKYESYIHKDGVKYGLGYYASPIEAALVRDAAADYFFGEYSNKNFSEEAVWWTG